MKRYLSLVIILFVAWQGHTVRGCGSSGTSSPNTLHLYSRNYVQVEDYPSHDYFQVLDTSFYGQETSPSAGATGSNTALSGTTTGDNGAGYGYYFFSNANLPGRWRFEETDSSQYCYNIFTQDKQVSPGGNFFYTCPVYVLGGQGNGGTPTVQSEDDTGAEVIDVNNVGEQLDENNQFLYAGDGLLSQSGEYTLLYLSDGNLVEFDSTYTAVWMSWTSGTGGGNAHVHLQDGNLVIYDSNTTPAFVSNTGGNVGAYMLCQNDGNIVIYDSGGTPLWSTGIP